MLQILNDQEVLTTERTRKLLLKIVVEGFLSDHESVATWEKKLQDLMRDHEGDPSLNRILWDTLTSQVRILWQRCASQHVQSFECFIYVYSVGSGVCFPCAHQRSQQENILHEHLLRIFFLHADVKRVRPDCTSTRIG